MMVYLFYFIEQTKYKQSQLETEYNNKTRYNWYKKIYKDFDK